MFAQHASTNYESDRVMLNYASLDFDLPAELEAGEPPEARGLARDEVRLMVSCGINCSPGSSSKPRQQPFSSP
jgi:hypothetical protein